MTEENIQRWNPRMWDDSQVSDCFLICLLLILHTLQYRVHSIHRIS